MEEAEQAQGPDRQDGPEQSVRRGSLAGRSCCAAGVPARVGHGGSAGFVQALGDRRAGLGNNEQQSGTP